MHRRQYIPHSRPSTRLDRAIDAERKRKAKAAAETAADAAAVRSRTKAIAAAKQAKSKPPLSSAFRSFVDRVKRVANTPVRMPSSLGFGRRA